MRTPIVVIPALALASWISLPADAGFTNIVGAQNAGAWFAGSPGYQSVTFTGFAEGTQITDQYASQGIVLGFAGSAGNGTQNNAFMYQEDGWGIVGNGSITATFASPMRAFAMHYPGAARFRFYSGATQLHFAELLSSGAGNFVGFTSDVGFDRVVISAYEPQNFGIFADNMYFSTVPTPAPVALLALAPALASRRRA